MKPMDEGLGHLLHFSDQLKAHLRDLQSVSPEEFAQMMRDHATPEEQALILIELERMQTESARIIGQIEDLWVAQGRDIEELRRRRKRDE
jgi:hypothetical protein